MLFIQQAGITYEFKPGMFGIGMTGGYIYPNRSEYSNYFLAGPTDYSSLGYYSGCFVEPQVNCYFFQKAKEGRTRLLYIALKGIYKYLTVDSTQKIAWYSQGGSSDGNTTYRKMDDRMNVYGAFVDFGFRLTGPLFFFDLNIGPGIMHLQHDMVIYGEAYGQSQVYYVNPPQQEVLEETHVTVNFSVNLGICF